MNLNKMFSLKNKTALIIGGTGKVGLSIVEGLIEAEAKVIIGTRDKEKAQKTIEKKIKDFSMIKIIEVDVSEYSNCIKFIKQIKKNSAKIDILINSFSDRPMKKFWDSNPKTWNKSMKTNADGLFNICKVVVDLMRIQKKGILLNISSIYGMVGPNMNIYKNIDFETEPDYPFVKSGMIGFTRYLASKFGEENIRSNCIVLGGVYNNQPKEFLLNYNQQVPLKRMAFPEEIKGPVIFLCSESSSYINGSVLAVDGGWTAI